VILQRINAGSPPLEVLGATWHALVSIGFFSLIYLSSVALLHQGLGPIRQLSRLLKDILPPRWRAAQRPMASGEQG